jgi:hypothetical protein
MTADVLTRLLYQIKILRGLGSEQADERTALLAMRQCSREIEDLTTDDMAADYARDIGIALGISPKGARVNAQLSHAIVAERIENLVAYVLILSVAFLTRNSSPEGV